MFLTCKKGEYWVNMGFLFCLTILFDRSRGDSRSLFRACSVAKLVCMCVLLFLSILCLCHLEHLQFSRDMWGLKKQCPDVVRSTLGELQVQRQESFLCSGQAEAQWNISPNINFLRYTPSCATPKSPFGPCFVYQSSVRTPPSTKQQPLTEI